MEQYSGETGSLDKNKTIISGMKLLSEGLKLYLISIIVVIVGIIIAIVALILAIGVVTSPDFIGPEDLEMFMNSVGIGILIIIILIIIISVIISIMALIKIKNGMETLSTIYSDVSVGATGARLMYYGLIITGISLLLIIVLVGIIGIFIGAIMILIGAILWGLGIINLDKYVSEDLKSPATLYIVGLVLGLIGLVPIGFIIGIVGIYLMYSRINYEIEIMMKKPIQQKYGSQSMEI